MWDEGEETAIQAPDARGPKITWSGPPLLPVLGEPRFHFHVAPVRGVTEASMIEQLFALGAIRLDAVRSCRNAIALADVDGNAFCLVDSK